MTRSDLEQIQVAAVIVTKLESWMNDLAQQDVIEREATMLHVRWHASEGVSIMADFSTELKQDYRLVWDSCTEEPETLTFDNCRSALQELLGIETRV